MRALISLIAQNALLKLTLINRLAIKHFWRDAVVRFALHEWLLCGLCCRWHDVQQRPLL
jgi:hypothetical protein